MKRIWSKRFGLTVSLVGFVFAVMMGTFVLVGSLALLLHKTGVVSFANARFGSGPDISAMIPFLAMLGLCTLLGTALTGFFSKRALKPIRKVIAATHQVAQGDFTARVDIRGIGELEELSDSFNKMAQELSTIETLRSDFVNNFSHEFKTPIVSIRGFAKLLRDSAPNEAERSEYLSIIIDESERLASLSTNVLTLSKYENIEIVPDKAAFRLDEQIRRAAALAEPKWAQKSLALNARLEEITYTGNEDLTQQIWLNLMDNAMKFSHPGGQISLELCREGQSIVFTLRDEGIGMDAATLQHIFDRFYQADASHLQAGNGLGLAIVRRIVLLCGGRIEVNSLPGRGSTFVVTLPG